jgi:hypothetical protein
MSMITTNVLFVILHVLNCSPTEAYRLVCVHQTDTPRSKRWTTAVQARPYPLLVLVDPRLV